MSNPKTPKFKVGQKVNFPFSRNNTLRSRSCGIIQKVEKMY